MADLWLKLSDHHKTNTLKRLFWLINKVGQKIFRFQFLPYINIAVKKIELKSKELYKYDLLVPSIVPVLLMEQANHIYIALSILILSFLPQYLYRVEIET